MLAEVPGHGAVRGLGLDRAAVRRHQHAGHEAERAEALGHDVGLDVAVVVLARPDDAAVAFDDLGDHVVDEPVLVGDPGRLELGLELGLEDLFEQVLEPAVVGLEDRVLGPMMMGLVQPGTKRGMLDTTIGSRKTTPPRMLRIVPFGDRHIRFSPNSVTRASSGVIVAHFTPTWCRLIAFAASIVTWSSVASRCWIDRS